MSNSILYEIDGLVAIITLNRPERLNAMDEAMLERLTVAADKAEKDDQIHAVVLGVPAMNFLVVLISKPRL